MGVDKEAFDIWKSSVKKTIADAIKARKDREAAEHREVPGPDRIGGMRQREIDAPTSTTEV